MCGLILAPLARRRGSEPGNRLLVGDVGSASTGGNRDDGVDMHATTVLHISDSHVVADSPTTPPASLAHDVELLRGESTAATLERLLGTAAAWGIDLILHTGDVVDDAAPASYRRAASILAAAGVHVEAVPGNHDNPAALAAALGEEPEVVRTVDLPGWRLILVHSQLPGHDHGAVCGDTFDRLVEAIDGSDTATMLAMHHPPISSCSDPGCQIADVGPLLDLIGQRPQVSLVVTGHLHLAGHDERNGVTFLRGPSTAIQLTHRHPLPANNRMVTPIGARVVQLFDDGTFEHRLEWLS